MKARITIFGAMIIMSTIAFGSTAVMSPSFDGGGSNDSGLIEAGSDGPSSEASCGDFFVDACSGPGTTGCGGFGGGGGTGGQGGGAAIALLASGTTSVTITNGGLFTGNGGTGGQGGGGQLGALGVAGDAGTSMKCSTNLCNCSALITYNGGGGGAGIQGGSGGQGGGGAGGPTYFYVMLGGATIDASPATINASVHLGDGGKGGLPNGADGVQGQHFP